MNILFLNHPEKESETWRRGKEIFDDHEPSESNLWNHYTYQNRDALEMALQYHDAVVVNDLGGLNWLDGSQLLYHKTVNLSVEQNPEKIFGILS